LRKVLMSQKDPAKIDWGKLARKKCRMVRTAEAIIPAPAKKLQKRPQGCPGRVSENSMLSLLHEV
jgi:hypothetical protein